MEENWVKIFEYELSRDVIENTYNKGDEYETSNYL